MDPRVGVGVFVLNSEGKFIIGKRKGSHGADTWGLPGGHLEFGEGFETCGERELLEETGLEVRNLQFWTATNSVFKDVTPNKHYVTIFLGGVVSDEGAQPQVSGLALLTGAVSAQLDTDALGLNPILGSNPLGGNTGRAIHSASPTSTPAPTSSPVTDHKRSGNPSFRRIVKKDIGGNLAGEPLGNFVGRKSSPSEKASSSIATPTSSPSGTPTTVPQSNKGILGRNNGNYEADSTIPVNLGQLLSGRDNGNYQADSTIPVNLGQLLSGRDISSSNAGSTVPGNLGSLLGDEDSPSTKPTSTQSPKPSSTRPAKHAKPSTSSSGFSKNQASPSATPTPSTIIRRRRRGNLGGSSMAPAPSATPTSVASTAYAPTSMQTKGHSTPLKYPSKETGVPKGSIDAAPQWN
ncbi:unnamed protein product [Penicillium pancosmium]